MLLSTVIVNRATTIPFPRLKVLLPYYPMSMSCQVLDTGQYLVGNAIFMSVSTIFYFNVDSYTRL